jgi:methyl-accepting chemotaxis protein
MSMLRLKDLPIAVKSLIAPVAGGLITVAIVAGVMVANSAARHSAEQAGTAERLAAAVTAARLELAQGHAALLRAVSLRAADAAEETIDASRKQAMEAVARGEAMTRNLKVPDSARAKADDLNTLVGKYKGAVAQTADVINDTFMAPLLMNDAHALSTDVNAAFQDFAAEITARSAELRNRADDATQEGITAVLILAAAGIVISFGLGLLPARLISRPVRDITAVLSKLAEGDLTTAVADDGRGDEIGAMTRAVVVLKRNSEEMRRLQAEQEETEARMAATRRADMHKLADSFESAVGKIVDAVSSAAVELEAAAATLTHSAETTRGQASMVASTAMQASGNVQSVASSSEELAGSVNEISRQVQESSKIAHEAVHQAEKTDSRITELSQAASRIGDVVKLITAIAEQTNLLALNATIEAARAGEAGRGFAVVAAEVKTLANQTAKATGDIGTQIAGMQAATNESVAAIKEIGTTIGRIAEIASTVAAAVEEQGAATQDISRNAHEAADGTAHVASTIAEVNRGAGETGSASNQVLTSAKALTLEGGKLKTEVERFLATVRAA